MKRLHETSFPMVCLPVLLVVSVLCVAVLFGLRITTPPASYRHTWNQITTLIAVDDIRRDLSLWNKPRDVVTRVVWEINDAGPDHPDVRFRIFEEFPLYHLIAGISARVLENSVVAGRLLSLLFFFGAAFGMYLLGRNSISPNVGLLSCLLFITSSPFLYYGQAVMSDMAMTATAIGGVYCAESWTRQGRWWRFCLALVLLTLSGLFKSYGVALTLIIPAALVVYAERSKKPVFMNFCFGCLLAIVCAGPAIAWHVWSSFQPGQHEMLTHSLPAKLDALCSATLWMSLLKAYFKYMGHLPGVIMLYVMVLPTGIRLQRKENFPWWIELWFGIALFYLWFTADKLINHDYYFMLIAPPFLILGALAINDLTQYLAERHGRLVACATLTLIIGATIGFSASAYLKATRPNPDIFYCAKLISENTDAEDLVATLTDVSRYNALAYYSGRRAINVEGITFPFERYRAAGASYLAVNMAGGGAVNYYLWLQFLPREAKLIWGSSWVKDAAGRNRHCYLFSLGGPHP